MNRERLPVLIICLGDDWSEVSAGLEWIHYLFDGWDQVPPRDIRDSVRGVKIIQPWELFQRLGAKPFYPSIQWTAPLKHNYYYDQSYKALFKVNVCILRRETFSCSITHPYNCDFVTPTFFTRWVSIALFLFIP